MKTVEIKTLDKSDLAGIRRAGLRLERARTLINDALRLIAVDGIKVNQPKAAPKPRKPRAKKGEQPQLPSVAKKAYPTDVPEVAAGAETPEE